MAERVPFGDFAATEQRGANHAGRDALNGWRVDLGQPFDDGRGFDTDPADWAIDTARSQHVDERSAGVIGQVGKGPGSGDDDRTVDLGEKGRKVGDRIAGPKFARVSDSKIECEAGALEPSGVGPGACQQPTSVVRVIGVEWAPVEADPSRYRRRAYRRVAAKNLALDVDRTIGRAECAPLAIVD